MTTRIGYRLGLPVRLPAPYFRRFAFGMGQNQDARFGRWANAPSDGLSMSIPLSSKSRMLRVATAIPRERAMAAI